MLLLSGDCLVLNGQVQYRGTCTCTKADWDTYGTEEYSLLRARLSMENVRVSRGEASTSGARDEQRRKHDVSGMILTDEIARCLRMC